MWNRPCTSPLRPSSPQMRLRQHQVHTVPAYCSLSLTGTLLCHSGDKQGCHALKDSQSMAQLSCVSPPRPHRVRSADCLPVQQSGLGPTNTARLHRMRANRGPCLLARGGFRTRGPRPRLEPGRLRVCWSWVRGVVTGAAGRSHGSPGWVAGIGPVLLKAAYPREMGYHQKPWWYVCTQLRTG